MRRLFRRSRQPDTAENTAPQAQAGAQNSATPQASAALLGPAAQRAPVAAQSPTVPRAPVVQAAVVAQAPTTLPGSVIVLPYRPANSPEELYKAASQGAVQVVQLLLDAGVPVGVRDSKGWTPLHRAVQQGHEPVVRLLLSRGALVSALGPGNLQPLHVAIKAQDARLARLLFAHGADIEASTGLTPFHLAVSSGSEELVDVLLEMGANPRALVTAETGRGETALHMAVAAWKDELLPRLLAAGLDVNAGGTKPAGQTPLHIAAWYGYESAARTLLDAGADVDARYADGQTALHKAAQYDQVNMCELLLERGADIVAATPQDDTALCVAAVYGKKRAAELLLDRGLHLMTPEQKAQVLISAAGAGRRDVTELLLEKGFDVNMTRHRISALDLAALYSHENVIIFLLEKGANPGIYGGHPRHSAQRAGKKDHDRIVGLLNGTIPLSSRNRGPSGGDLVDPVSLAWALSADTTMASKRRIMANPNPGGFPPQCHVCQDLDFRRGVPKDAEVIHWVFQGKMVEAASRGCPGCEMIRQCLQHLASVYGEGLAAWRTATKPCELLSTVHGGPLYVACGDGLGSQPTVRAEIYSRSGFPVTWPVVGLARDVSAAPWSDQRRSFVRGSLEECITKHPTCSYKDSVMPSRVIDVGSNTIDPRLHIPNGEIGRYVTLSHCWGGSTPITTTLATLESHTMGIPLATLPKTFRDAILITRDLGIRYLWIDSLCILQDSLEDWEREAHNMSAIYENGYVMIAAEDSENCHGGCFPPSVPHGSHTFSIGVKGPGGRNSKVHFRLTNVLSDDRGEVCHRLYCTQNGFRRSALDTRGWTLQERILAPRTLHFGKSEVGWECARRRACECQTVQTQTDTDSRFKAQLLNFEWHASAQGASSAGVAAEKRWIWSNIIQEFTHRNLTKSQDLLPALSGLAKRMSRTAEDDYVCGMWRDKLQAFLFWKPDYRYIRGNALTRVPRRHQGGYYAPSWSWASVIAPVTYGGLGEESPVGTMWNKPYPINKGETNWREREGGGLIKVLDIQIVRAGLNPFGPVKFASLTVRGFVVTAFFQGKQKDLHLQSSTNGGLLVNTQGGVSSAQADFEPDVLDEQAEVFVGDKLCLLFSSESRTSEEGMRTLPNGKLEGIMRTAGGGGLVLKPVVGREGNYNRVGTFVYGGAAAWEAWRSLRIERTICLV